MIRCPSCGGEPGHSFYDLSAVPTNSCLLVGSRAAALAFPVAPISLRWCQDCGFIFNAAWEESRTIYSEAYEETQGFSATFSVFHDRLARDLIERHDLRGKRVVEIGCGKGEFLTLLCRLGDNTGVGYDPSFVPSRVRSDVAGQVRFVQEYFDGSTKLDRCDAVCCKMTLEHIPDVGRFIANLRSALDGKAETLVFFQVPNAGYILGSGAFWDVYYEHCSYFTAASLSNLFERCGFDVRKVWTDYDDQYLMIEAYPSGEPKSIRMTPDERRSLERQIAVFVDLVEASRQRWLDRLRGQSESGKRVALWGSGSKAVSFLTSLGLDGEVACAVDINPFRHGHFLPATGHAIVAPDELPKIAPDTVVVMNPVYRSEVQSALQMRGCEPELLTL
jgi:2-polyprenyl-3-methyl-5-hydroxy-6-metoxy-1,4-benzoquinol methylase